MAGYRSLALLAALMGTASGLAPAAAWAVEFSPAQKTEIGAVVKDYLLHNPEVLREAMLELDRRQKQQAQADQKKLTADPKSKLYETVNQDIVGNPNGTVTVVEFFDYNCGYCKRALGDLQKLVSRDPQLKVILKDIPILSQESVEAATVEAAVRKQFNADQLWSYHQKLLLSHGPVGKTQALDVARTLGADMTKLDKDMRDPAIKKGIDEALELAKSLDVNGTPSYVVGQEVVVGAVGFDDLKTKLANTHACGKATC